jgi:mono/diheme cytochrome c family protein
LQGALSVRVFVVVGLAASLAALAGPTFAAAPRATPTVERGAQVAQDRCAACHAVAMETKSPNRVAPLFRVLSRLYSAKDIETKLAAISEHGHFEMPPLSLREDEIEDVAAYIQSLDGGASGAPPPMNAARHRHDAARKIPAQWITSAAKRSISSY